MDIGYVTSVTLTEFLVWYWTGELRLLARRLIPVGLTPDGLPEADKLVRRQVMELLPHVDLEDEHNVLVVALVGDAGWAGDQAGAFARLLALDETYVPAESILSVQPLTRRAADILKVRLDGMDVRLECPLFEEDTDRLWLEWSQRRSARGATALVDIAVKRPTYRPSKVFADHAKEAVRLINAQRVSPPQDSSLLVRVMCYNRHEPIPETDVGFFLDLGLILKQYAAVYPDRLPVVDRMRQFCKMLQTDDRGLPELLTLSPVRDTFLEYGKEHGSELDLAAASLFLKWKYRMQRTQRIEVERLLADVQDCAGRVAKRSVEQAVWIFGFYCGFDRMAHDCYVRGTGRYRFIERGISHEAVELEEVTAMSPTRDNMKTQAETGPEVRVEAKSPLEQSAPEEPPPPEPVVPRTRGPQTDSLSMKMRKKDLQQALTNRGIRWDRRWTKEELLVAAQRAPDSAEEGLLGFEACEGTAESNA